MKETHVKRYANIDETDLLILSLLKDNARISIKNIAEKTYLSSTAISARIEKLEKAGYSEGYYAICSPYNYVV